MFVLKERERLGCGTVRENGEDLETVAKGEEGGGLLCKTAGQGKVMGGTREY